VFRRCPLQSLLERWNCGMSQTSLVWRSLFGPRSFTSPISIIMTWCFPSKFSAHATEWGPAKAFLHKGNVLAHDQLSALWPVEPEPKQFWIPGAGTKHFSEPEPGIWVPVQASYKNNKMFFSVFWTKQYWSRSLKFDYRLHSPFYDAIKETNRLYKRATHASSRNT